MKEIIENQKKFFNSHTTKNVDFRILQLKKLKDLIQANQVLLDEAIYNDFKRSSYENFATEIGQIYHELNTAIDNLKNWAKPKRVGTDLINIPAKSYIIPEPLGVVLVIGAWNYPYLISLAPLISAVAAGNTVVLKPSEIAVNSSKVLADLINNNFDPAFLKVVEGGIPETTALLDNPFDKIFFTGSPAVGKIVYQAAAKYLTPVTLELGGKSPSIFTENCDLKITVKRMVWSKFFNAGQTCIAPDYVFVHESIKKTFLKLVKKEIKKAHYSFENGNYIQIINEKNTERIIKLLDKDKVYYGGNYDIENRYIEPTIMTKVSFEDAVMQEEIFGPILPVITYKDFDEVINYINSQPKPLSCYLNTNDKKITDKFLEQVSFGGGAINDAMMHFSNSNLPFGGVGNSGMGSYHGKYGFDTFSHFKSVLNKSTLFEANFKYSPYTKGKLNIIKRLLSLSSKF